MKTVLKIYSRIVLFLFPLFFLPVIYNSFILGKISFLFISALIALLLWLVDLIVFKGGVIKWNRLLIWFLALIVWMGISFFRLDPGVMMRSLLSQSGLGFFLGVFIWLFIWIQIADREEQKVQFKILTASGILVAGLSLFAFMIPVTKLPLLWPKNNPILSINSGWSITGSLIGEIIFFLVLSLSWLSKLLKKIRKRVEIGGYLKEAVGVIFFGLLLFLDIYKLIKMGWSGLDGRSSWVIAVESLKRSPIFGMGVGNFYEAFQSFRPVSFNLTKVWSSAFSSGLMSWLSLWTELGLVALLLIIIGVINLVKKSKNKGIGIILALSLLVLLTPINFMGVFLLFWVAAFNGAFETKESSLRLVVGESKFNVMPFVLAFLVLLLVGFGSYWTSRMLIADGYWKKSLVASSKGDGAGAYNWQIKAIGMNPNMANYRVVYSQTNLALANNFFGGEEEVSEENKEKGAVLVQQAVREARAATALDRMNANYWLNLAEIYRSLIGTVDEVDGWSFEAYQQAILLDPVSPLNKLDLGGLLYASGNFEGADRLFEESVAKKNDYANAWYNWAHSAKKLNKIQEAVARLEKSISLVPIDSGDYEQASEILMEWKAELEKLIAENQAMQAEQMKEAESLKVPEPIPETNENNKVEIEAVEEVLVEPEEEIEAEPEEEIENE